MPKRTNDFQGLIAMIERQLAPQGARVVESALLRDQKTGEEREVDVLIETEVGGHPVMVGIECIDRTRPASVQWIDGILGQYRDLPVNKIVAVSRAGFSKKALQKAAKNNIETLSLTEATELDWTAIVNKLKTIPVESFLLPYLTKVKAIFAGGPSSRPPTESELPQAILYSPTGSPRGQLIEVAKRLLADPNFIQAIEEEAFTDSGTVVDSEMRFAKGTYILDGAGTKHLVHSLQIQAKCRKEVSTIVLEHGIYGQTPVAFGTGETFKRRLAITFVEQPGERPNPDYSRRDE